jgi:HK97 family phage major capsid protein
MSEVATAPEAEFKAAVAGLKKATDEVKTFAETANTEIKNLGKVTEETKASADKALTDMNAITARLTDVEQKMTRRGQAEQPVERKSIGQQFLENENVKALLSSTTKRGNVNVPIEMKTVNTLTTGTTLLGSGTSPTTSLVVAERGPMVNLPERRFTVRDLITPGQTNSNAIEYPVELVFQNLAAVVAEGAAKAKSDVTFDLKQTGVRTIAHYMKASRQIMDDAPMLQSYIDGRLRYGLAYVEETELLYGDGTGQHLLGIIPQATAYSAAFTPTDETAIDRLRLAALQATLALYPATGYVLHPTDWAKVEMQKNSLGNYVVGDPQGVIAPRLWGLPVVATQAITAGTFLAGAFRLGAQIFDRMQVEVLLSTENEDDFIKNLITIRCEERLALAVYVPLAFTTGSLPA